MKYKDFHPLIQNKIMERQKEQGNEPNLEVSCIAGSNIGGFHWDPTPEGVDFWRKVLTTNSEEAFFEKYPLKRDSIVDSVRQDLLNRSMVGVKKYQTTLDREDIDLLGWLRHQYEELLDAALYCKRAIKDLENPKIHIGKVEDSLLPNPCFSNIWNYSRPTLSVDQLLNQEETEEYYPDTTI